MLALLLGRNSLLSLCLLHQPFVGPLHDEIVTAAFQDIEARMNVSPASLPSCCFFTFVNSKQTLTCTAFTKDAVRVAGEPLGSR